MICPNCGAQLPDTATICFSCRKQFKNNPESNTGELKKAQPKPQQQPPKKPRIDMQRTAAAQEAQDLKTDLPLHIIFMVAGIAVGLLFYFAIDEVGGKVFCGIGIAFFVYHLSKYITKKNRIEELDLISQGHKRINLCPNCKSPHIEMQVVQSGSVSTHGKTTISENINPLRPFTHTNVNQGNTYTVNAYGNKCHCLDCGAIFNTPEVHYQ